MEPSSEEYPTIPVIDGFVQSFELNDTENWIPFYRKFGVVVIRDVVSSKEIDDTIDEIWQHTLNIAGLKRDDMSTWENGAWPSQMGLAEGGFLSHYTDINLQCMCNNRQNPNIVKAFQLVLEKEALWVNFDRTGFMRPTRNIKLPDGSVVDKPEWKTKSNWLHWDQNPWKNPGFQGVQGLLALSDSLENTGGFHCVPGFLHLFKDWSVANENFKSRAGLVNVPQGDPMRQHVQKITTRKGSLVIWDSRTPHGNYPNDSDQPRIVQYITFFPAKEDDPREAESRLNVFYTRCLSAEPSQAIDVPQLTELGEKILGIRRWSNGKKIDFVF